MMDSTCAKTHHLDRKTNCLTSTSSLWPSRCKIRHQVFNLYKEDRAPSLRALLSMKRNRIRAGYVTIAGLLVVAALLVGCNRPMQTAEFQPEILPLPPQLTTYEAM